jgi:hypothetical protein
MKIIFQLLRLEGNSLGLSIWKTIGYCFTGRAYLKPIKKGRFLKKNTKLEDEQL